MLYIPYFLWKLWEGGRMKNVCQDFGAPVIASNWNRSEKIRIVKYLCQGNNESIHRLYAYRFMFCEILNMVMLIVAIWILNVVFDNFWIDYAKAIRSVLQRDSAGWAINTARIFPKLGKCTFHRFGPSGTVVNRDALCLLPLNIINEKVFAILWLWMLFLLAVSILNLIYKALIFFSHHLRIKILQSQSCGQKYSDIRLVTHNGDLGKWFFLYQMSRNVNPVIFCEIMRELFKYERDRMIYEKNHEDPEETI
uniref:Innexin n=1 Tax=Lutzomyia longipalpis TaxID=7200 RepID=A0A1B0GJM5_LUTLO